MDVSTTRNVMESKKEKERKQVRHVMMIIGLCLRIDHRIHTHQGNGEDRIVQYHYKSFWKTVFKHNSYLSRI